MTGTEEPSSGLTAAEAVIYDRQLRTWGVAAQTRLVNANILFIGKHLGTGIFGEVLKNLVLAGVGTVTIASRTSLITESDLSGSFLLTESDVGNPFNKTLVKALKDLNPLIKIGELLENGNHTLEKADIIISDFYDYNIETEKGLYDDQKHEEFLKIVDTVSLSKNLDEAKSLFVLMHSGIYGGCYHQSQASEKLSDLLDAHLDRRAVIHSPVTEVFFDWMSKSQSLSDSPRNSPTTKRRKIADLPSWFSPEGTGPLVSVAAILGGVTAQEAMKCVTKKDEPLKNFILSDLGTMITTVEELKIKEQASSPGIAGEVKALGTIASGGQTGNVNPVQRGIASGGNPVATKPVEKNMEVIELSDSDD